MYFKKEFDDLVHDFEENLEDKYRGVSYGFLCSPLMQSNFVIVGSNVGGKTDEERQKDMPSTSEILDQENKNPTHIGYRNFFTLLFQGDKSKASSFIHKSVCTNACFIRTPREKKKYADLLEYGYKYSRDFLVRILSLVKPKLIIAFGNGSNPTATSAMAGILGIGEKYWTNENVEQIKLANWNSYIFEGELDSKRIELFSFPHASKYNKWSSSLENKKTFVELRKRIISHCHTQTK